MNKSLLLILLLSLLSCRLKDASELQTGGQGPLEEDITFYDGNGGWSEINLPGPLQRAAIFGMDVELDQNRKLHAAVILTYYDEMTRTYKQRLSYFTNKNGSWNHYALKESDFLFAFSNYGSFKKKTLKIHIDENQNPKIVYLSEVRSAKLMSFDGEFTNEQTLQTSVSAFDTVHDVANGVLHFLFATLENGNSKNLTYKKLNRSLEVVETKTYSFLTATKYTPHIEQKFYGGDHYIFVNGYSDGIFREKLFMMRNNDVFNIAYLDTESAMFNLVFENELFSVCYIGVGLKRYVAQINLNAIVQETTLMNFEEEYTTNRNCHVSSDGQLPVIYYDYSEYANFLFYNFFKKMQGTMELDLDRIDLVKNVGEQLFIGGVSLKNDSVTFYVKSKQ